MPSAVASDVVLVIVIVIAVVVVAVAVRHRGKRMIAIIITALTRRAEGKCAVLDYLCSYAPFGVSVDGGSVANGAYNRCFPLRT